MLHDKIAIRVIDLTLFSIELKTTLNQLKY